MDETMDLYAELGVTPKAETDVIRAAYRALAKRYHPDVQVGASPMAAAKMSRINQAYAVLGDPGRRMAYDRQRFMPPARFQNAADPRTTARSFLQGAMPFLTTYDRRGRLHTYA